MGSSSPDIAAALLSAARSINDTESLEETLDGIACAARDAVPGIDHAGISITHPDGRIQTLAGTDELVWELDSLQYDLSEGPCVDSVHSDAVVVVDHAARDPRWPNYLPRAVEKGLRAQLALRIYAKHQTLGGLNLYSTGSDTIDPDAVHVAELFATHAAIAFGQARHEHQLTHAIATRTTIGQAIGIVMERYRISEDRAFRFLVRASSTSNTKLREVAQALVDATNHEYTPTDRTSG